MLISIAKPGLLEIFDEKTNKKFIGCRQQWFRSTWQRLSGCGPSAAANIYYYMTHSHSADNLPVSKDVWLTLMEEIWGYVKPSIRGVHQTKMFYEPLYQFMTTKGLDVEYKVWEVPKEKWRRLPFPELIKFIENALKDDNPVAFLNLCNGQVTFLERWHWVTIISLDYNHDHAKERAFVEILDQGLIKKIDLSTWYTTTTLGGGFVYFSNKG